MRQQGNGVAGNGLQDGMASESSVLYVGLSSLSLFPLPPSLSFLSLSLPLSLTHSLTHYFSLALRFGVFFGMRV
jgi:hypothetical protein